MPPPLPSSPRPARPRLGFDALAFGVITIFCALTYVETASLSATARDQSSDLALALRMREQGEVSDGNRHPLLSALLAPFASREPSFFVTARAVAAAAAALGLALAYAGAALVFSRPLALLALVVSLFEWRLQARRIAPEPLLAGLLALGIGALARGATARRPLLVAAAGGAALGLAWLAKGSALLTLAAAAVALPLLRGRRGLAHAAAALGGFAVAASPLLAWNVGAHGDPFFNANTTHVQWEASWDADLDRTSRATPGSWFAEHGAGGSLRRLGGGLVRQKGLEWPYAFLALVVAASVVRRRRPPEASEDPARRDWRGLAVASCLAWVPPLAWYEPIVASRRLLFPLVPVLAPSALDLVGRWVRGGAASRVASAVARTGVVAGAALAVAGVALALARGASTPRDHFAPGALEAASRLAEGAGGERVLARPSRTAPPEWLVEGQAVLGSMPSAVPAADAAAWIRERFDGVLLTSGLLAQRRAALAPLARWDDAEGVVLAHPLPDGFARVEHDPARPSSYAILSTGRRASRRRSAAVPAPRARASARKARAVRTGATRGA